MFRIFSVAAIVTGLSLGAAAAAQERPAPTVSPDLPPDVEIPGGVGGNPIAFFDDFSWRSFIALNWSAKPGERGVADPGAEFKTPSDRLVWESWPADYEAVPAGGARPKAWDDLSGASPCGAGAPAMRVLGAVAAPGALVIEHYNQAGFGNPIGSLASANRKYVLYEIRMNRTQFDFIRGADDDESQWLYLAKNLPDVDDPTLTFPTGSVEIKAAWRQFDLPTEDPLRPRYLTRKAMIKDPATGVCEERTVGLIGLHIVHRTPTMREWVWSSFEHVDNLADEGSGMPATFPAPTGPDDQNILLPIVNPTSPPLSSPDPVRIKRLKGVHTSTDQTNQDYHAHPEIAGSVWENYRLVLTQWPTQPAADDAEFRSRFNGEFTPENRGTPFPADTDETSISNVTMETTDFQQTVSCMTCHHLRGGGKNTEFVWFLRLRAHRENPAMAAVEAENLRKFTEGWIESMKARK